MIHRGSRGADAPVGVKKTLALALSAAALALPLAACSVSAPTAAGTLQHDGYGLSASNPSPRPWVSSEACGLRGQSAEEVVIVKPDAGSQQVAASAVAAVKGSGLTVSYASPVIRLTGTLDSFAAKDLCQWK
jgi:hypothetical protein